MIIPTKAGYQAENTTVCFRSYKTKAYSGCTRRWHRRPIPPEGSASLSPQQSGGLALIGQADSPKNITLLFLPSRSPELNPGENVWQFMRDNWLSKRGFTSYDDIVDHCCEAWKKLIEQPWKIMSIGLRDWAPSVMI